MRCGSTQLSKWLSTELNYKWYNEPHNDVVETEQPQLGENNIVVKEIWHHIHQLPNFKKYISSFDKVIGLIRENIRECAISIQHFRYVSHDKKHSPYYINDEWIINNDSEIQRLYSEIIERNEEIRNNTPFLVTYEGIYESGNDKQKLIDYLAIKNITNFTLLNNDFRLRNKKIKFI